MKILNLNFQRLFFCFLIYYLASCNFAQKNDKQNDVSSDDKVYYAIEINNVVCGYSESYENPIKQNGKDLLEQNINIFIMLSLLGSEFNTEMNSTAIIEPQTRKASYVKTTIKQGATDIYIELTLNGDKAMIKSPMTTQEKQIDITPETLIGSDEMFSKLKNEFINEGKIDAEYNILELVEGEIQTSKFKKIGEEEILLINKTFKSIIIEQTNTKTGLRTTYWLSPDFGYFIKFEVLNRKIYLSDQNVIDKIKVANMDENIVTKTNVAISDVPSLSYMKIKAVIEPTGNVFSEGDLNVPGQKFLGTVVENHIEGIFEISHKKYSGENAPPFPANYNNKEIAKYLVADGRIECEDTVLIKKAKEIVEGSTDSWEAAKRISKWVAENIHYAIPGGGTARKTYDIRAGECGAQSFLLASFCRAVGIPARVVWGGMYIPNYGGGFGQHGWNEVYMGDAGWIPVDATALEIDFVDAGHIRISEYQSASSSFNGKSFEVLEYKLDEMRIETAKIDFNEYLGKYTNLESGRTFEVLNKEGNLSVNIPGQMVLPFNQPEEKGKWFCKLSPTLYLEFTRDEGNKINKMLLHEIAQMTKNSSLEKIDDKVPENLKPYLGDYLFAAINQNFNVFYLDNSLAIHDPTKNEDIRLQLPNEEGGWIDEFNKNIVYFEMDKNQNVTALKIDVANHFTKGELASDSLDRMIKSEGIESAMQKYHLLRLESDSNLIFSEHSINLLGYKYLNDGKSQEALEIFKMNVADYPKSFNVYDSLGEAFIKNGNKDDAIKNYRKSLELNPDNSNAKSMLEKINSEN